MRLAAIFLYVVLSAFIGIYLGVFIPVYTHFIPKMETQNLRLFTAADIAELDLSM